MNYFNFLIICLKFNIISNSFLFSLLIFYVFRQFFKFISVAMHEKGFFANVWQNTTSLSWLQTALPDYTRPCLHRARLPRGLRVVAPRQHRSSRNHFSIPVSRRSPTFAVQPFFLVIDESNDIDCEKILAI